ncbi:PaaI family thioesterase [Blastococcus sp. TF02A-26]|uniref:PaaI family thioesterase n=1 Tax=Blastococcus sp. TF02A-26 TaxID=2250577 RepID=UPI000DEBAA86|nr:PaaI family thioesterase [Blastococcus sp. TF02A-26]RBY85291.1 aromatic compound degradation protein PaaI [Blastococcus sp. TF02A-26]
MSTDLSPEIAPAPAAWGEPRSRTVTWYDPMLTAAGALERSGLETLEALRDGVLPPPPIVPLVQMDLVAVEEGRVEFSCLVDESVYNPIGVVHGGLVCTLLDTVAGCAVHSTLPRGTGYTSIELKVTYLRAVTADSGPLRAVGRVVKPGRRVAFAEGEVVDAAGRSVATASSSLLVFPIPG